MPGASIGTRMLGKKRTLWRALQITITTQEGKSSLEKYVTEGDPNLDHKIREFLDSLVNELNSRGGDDAGSTDQVR